tara:strand:- start:1208 stop:1420 length:213 start_codon:yes stop_codon:yes gene_type:complete
MLTVVQIGKFAATRKMLSHLYSLKNSEAILLGMGSKSYNSLLRGMRIGEVKHLIFKWFRAIVDDSMHVSG